jgi:hypothetical protein
MEVSWVMGGSGKRNVRTSDAIIGALTSKGLELPAHASEVGSNLASDKHYDQIAFFPGPAFATTCQITAVVAGVGV